MYQWERRETFRCALPGFPRHRWSAKVHLGYSMGGSPPRPGAPTPGESHDEGCPGAWFRGGFVSSIMPFERQCSGDGVYSPNLLLDRCDDPLVLEAVDYLERERARCARRDFEASR